MNCFTAKACGQRLPLLSITLQGCTSFRHLTPVRLLADSIPFIVSPQPRLPAQECFHSFHFAQANPQFHSAPLWLSNPQPRTQSQNGKLHSTQPHSLLSIQSPSLLFPSQSAVCPVELSTPENQRPQNSPPPFNGAGKNKGSFPHGHCACSRFVSLIQPFAVTLVPHATAH